MVRPPESLMGKVVRVDWQDAAGTHEQTSPEDWPMEFPMQSYGVVVRETERFLSVASEVCPEGEFRCIVHLPWAMVEGITELTRS